MEAGGVLANTWTRAFLDPAEGIKASVGEKKARVVTMGQTPVWATEIKLKKSQFMAARDDILGQFKLPRCSSAWK